MTLEWSAPVKFRSAVLWAVFLGMAGGLLLSASPDLHSRYHECSDGHEHECLATILSAGGCESLPVIGSSVASRLPVAGEVPAEEPARPVTRPSDGATYKRGPPAAGV